MALLSIVVPVFGNAGSLEELHARVSAAVGRVEGLELELVFVDDGSPDSSWDVISRLASGDLRVRALGLSRNFGSNAALLAGLQHAKGDAVVTLAADLQDPPEILPDLVAAWRGGAKVVLAARRERDDPFFSRLFAAAFNRLFRLLVFPQFPREGFDIVLLDRQVTDTLVAMPEKNSYLFGQVMWVGFPRATVHYRRVGRVHGRSAWTFWRKVKYLIDAFTAFSYLPVRAASVLGFAMAALGFAYAAVVLTMRLAGQIIEPRGFTTLMIVVLLSGGVQLVVAGLIGEYLWRTLEEVRPRPPFVVSRRLNLAGGEEPEALLTSRR